MCVDMNNGRITENVFTLVTYNKLMLLSTSEGPCPCMPVPDRPGPAEGQGIRAGGWMLGVTFCSRDRVQDNIVIGAAVGKIS